MTLAILLALAALLAIYLIVTYNGLVGARQRMREGWSGISVQLKRRADLIPNMVASVKGYASHERGTLEEVTRLRQLAQAAGDAGPAERARIEGQLGAAIGRLLAVVENYPELKASQTFIDLQATLRDTEDQIQLARRYYNGAVREQNLRVEQFPSNLVARAFGFSSGEYFEIEDPAERAVPKVSF